MKVLVSAASKHGSTAEIANSIGSALSKLGLDVVVLPVGEVDGVDGYDAVILGSAVYAGHWLQAAKDLIDTNAADLATRPVWLFSSGPIGDPPKPEEDPVDVVDVCATTRARDHQVFAGKIERSKLGFAERAIVAALRAPTGDFRDWEAIDRWAATIADELSDRVATG